LIKNASSTIAIAPVALKLPIANPLPPSVVHAESADYWGEFEQKDVVGSGGGLRRGFEQKDAKVAKGECRRGDFEQKGNQGSKGGMQKRGF
jgi:hypothetical protein